MKWRIAKRQSEDNFLNRIEETYGSRDKILIAYGNWSQNRQMKHMMPSMGVGLRRLISKRFVTVLIDEFRSSMLCNHCHHKLENYQGCYRVLLCPNCQNNKRVSRNSIFIELLNKY